MKGNQPSKWLIIAAYFVVYVVWGSTYFFIDKALHGFSPFILGSFRFIAASTMLMGYCKLKGYKLWDKQIVKQCMFTGFMLLFIDMAGIIWSEQFLPSGIVAIMAASAAIWFIVLDKPKWKQNFSSIPTILGVLLGFVGVLMLFYEQTITVHADADQQFLNMIGLIVLIFCSIAWTLGSLYSKYVTEKQKKEVTKPKEVPSIPLTHVALPSVSGTRPSLAPWIPWCPARPCAFAMTTTRCRCWHKCSNVTVTGW